MWCFSVELSISKHFIVLYTCKLCVYVHLYMLDMFEVIRALCVHMCRGQLLHQWTCCCLQICLDGKKSSQDELELTASFAGVKNRRVRLVLCVHIHVYVQSSVVREITCRGFEYHSRWLI